MQRTAFIAQIQQHLEHYPVVALLGPRQCGKTTLVRQYIAAMTSLPESNYFDLEDPEDLMRLENAKLTLSALRGLVVIDEIQRKPNLFPLLRTLVDQTPRRLQFLILGSASRDLIQQSSETLAGRIRYLELTPFQLHEVDDIPKRWLRGGFPLSYLAIDDTVSYDWRKSYIATFLERDVPSFGIQIPPLSLRRFWQMLSGYHGAIFNASEIGNSLGISHPTVKRYLDVLTGTFMVRQLPPWFENIHKRQVKSPKIYFRDSGILHALLGIQDSAALQLHHKLGASWEGFALESIIQYYQADAEDCFFWGVHSGPELDLLIHKDGKKLGFEFKYSDAPTITKSMYAALALLQLDSLTIVYPGTKSYPLAENIMVKSLSTYRVTDL